MSGPRVLPMLAMFPGEPPEAPATDASHAAAHYRVDGMDCASCAKTVEAVAAIDGVRVARVSFGNATLLVEGDVEAGQVQPVVARAGYHAHPAKRRRGEPVTPFWRRDVRTISTLASIVLLVVAVIASLADAPPTLTEPLYLGSMAVGG